MRRFVLVLVLIAIGTFAAACGSSENDSLKGKITIYTSMYEDVMEIIEEKLNKEFKNVDIELFYGSTAKLQEKVENELAEGQLGCDMLMIADPAYSLEMEEAGLLHSYMYPEASKLDFEYDSEGYWYPVRISNMVLAYNPEKLEKSSAPASFYDFAYSEKLRGKTAMPNPLTSGTALTTMAALSEKYGYEYFEALSQQKTEIGSSSKALEKLEDGKLDAVMVLEEVVLKRREEEKSKVEIIYPADGTVCIPSTIMSISKEKSPHKNVEAAEAITRWFLSEEGQKNIVDGWMHSVIADFETAPQGAVPTDKILENVMHVSWNACFKQKDEIMRRFSEALGMKFEENMAAEEQE